MKKAEALREMTVGSRTGLEGVNELVDALQKEPFTLPWERHNAITYGEGLALLTEGHEKGDDTLMFKGVMRVAAALEAALSEGDIPRGKFDRWLDCLSACWLLSLHLIE